LTAGFVGIRADLAATARERAARPARRGRRGLSVVLASVVGLVVVGGAANALVTGSTGVPAADRLLGIYERGLSDSGANGPSGSDLQPQSGSRSGSVSMMLADGARITSTVYVGRGGRICTAVTRDDGSDTAGGIECVSPDDLRRHLARDEGYIFSYYRSGTTAIAHGLVSDRVTGLTGREQPLAIELGEAWAASDADIDGVRLFIAAGKATPNVLVRPDDVALVATTEDGRETTIDDRP
jgi:hypothetical protein